MHAVPFSRNGAVDVEVVVQKPGVAESEVSSGFASELVNCRRLRLFPHDPLSCNYTYKVLRFVSLPNSEGNVPSAAMAPKLVLFQPWYM
jgi:hypothetical protein